MARLWALLVIGSLLGAALLPLSVARAADVYVPTIPPGYSPQVVLHVDYGTTPETVGVRWGVESEGGDYPEAMSVTEMRVVGDRFYFIDETVQEVKQFRSPGTLVWASESFTNLGDFAVASEGRAYLIWGADRGRLSCLGSDGRLLWTKRTDEVIPEPKRVQLGEAIGFLGWHSLEWTARGLTMVVLASSHRDLREYTIILGEDGVMRERLPGTMVGSDGAVYDLQLNDQHGKRLSSPVVTRWEIPGRLDRQIRLNLQAEKGKYLAGIRPNAGKFRMRTDPVGGFDVEQFAHLSAPVQVTSQMRTILEQVLWRLDSEGNPTEQWRFPANSFCSRAGGIVPGNDGSVYYLKFGDTGIDVVKYNRGPAGEAGKQPKR